MYFCLYDKIDSLNTFSPIYVSRYNDLSENTTTTLLFNCMFDCYIYNNEWHNDTNSVIKFESFNASDKEKITNDMLYTASSVEKFSKENPVDNSFYFINIPIKKGDIVKVSRTVTSEQRGCWFSNEIRKTSSVDSIRIEFDSYNNAIVEAEQDWNGITLWSYKKTPNSSYDNYEFDIIHKNLLIPNPKREVIVCPSDGSLFDKARADFVCDGINDEIEINDAIEKVKDCIGKVILCNGNFYVDSFNEYTLSGKKEYVAIAMETSKGQGSTVGVSIEGASNGKVGSTTIINVRDSAFNNIDEELTPSVFGGGSSAVGYVGGKGINISGIKIVFSRNDRKCIGINMQHFYWGEIKRCNITYTGYGQNVVATEGFVAFRGWAGWSDGSVIGIYDTYVSGFYTAFQIGGEHVICERLGARYNYIAYTFGEYELDENSGSQVHPITMINCCDEHSACLPKFYGSGNASKKGANRVEVSFISFNIEYYPLITGIEVVGAEEVVDGGWVGRIDYTVENNEQNSSVYHKFWADGHGKNFITTNLAHCQIGTTSLRNTYAPNYMQQYFDTDLNKVIYCKEPSTKTWIDANGNVV